LKEDGIEYGFVGKLQGLKHEYRPDITDRASLQRNFREKFKELNRVRLTDAEFARFSKAKPSDPAQNGYPTDLACPSMTGKKVADLFNR